MGGPALHVVGLHVGLGQASVGPSRFDSTLLVGRPGRGEGDMAYIAEAAAVEPEPVPHLGPDRGVMDDLRALVWLVRRFRADRPTIVHTHTAKAGAIGRLAAVIAGVPIRLHTYHGHVLGGEYFSAAKTSLFRWIEQALGRVTQRVVVLSPRQRDELAGRLRIAANEKFVVVPLGLDLSAFAAADRAAARVQLREELGLDEDTWIVASIGRIVPVKNHELLLRAFAALVAGSSDKGSCALVIAGDGEAALRERLQLLGDQLGIADRVHWLGWRRDVPELHAGSDVLALTSKDEGTPVAVLEALAAGTPVVARAVGGVPDVIAGRPHAIAVSSPDPTSFASALLRARESPNGSATDRAAREGVARQFGLPRLVADIGALYEEELSRLGC